MKRSEINAALRELEAMCEKHCCYLPPFCHFTPAQWQEIGHEYDEGYGGYGYEPVEPRTAIGRDAQRGEPAEKGGIHFEL